VKDIFKILKESVVLYLKTMDNTIDYTEELKKTCKTVYTTSTKEESKTLITSKNINIIISDIDISSFNPNIAFYLLKEEKLKTTEFLSQISVKIQKSANIQKIAKTADIATKLLNDEKNKSKKIATFAATKENKLRTLDFVIDELLVKFKINKDGIVLSISKNFQEIFGFREEYIVNEDISKIVNGSILQKTLLGVTRHKKPVVEYITFNTATGVIIEPMVVIVPYFDNTEYLNTYSLYCTLQ